MESPSVIVLCGGGSSAEREISLQSGENVAGACAHLFSTKKITLDRDGLPAEIMDSDAIIFPLTHGKFGEDGRLQALLERSGLTFVGSDSESSALCMDKCRTKEVVAVAGLAVAAGTKISRARMPSPSSLVAAFGPDLFLKPNCGGSSVDTHRISSEEELEIAMARMHDDEEYVLERRIDGVELSVGILDGKALEVVEIRSKVGFFDYENKYTPGKTDEFCPARIPKSVARLAKECGEMAFAQCRCRDWARADLILSTDGQLFFLEINTIPGMTKNSLFPKSAAAAGLDFTTLVGRLLSLAAGRKSNGSNQP